MWDHIVDLYECQTTLIIMFRNEELKLKTRFMLRNQHRSGNGKELKWGVLCDLPAEQSKNATGFLHCAEKKTLLDFYIHHLC